MHLLLFVLLTPPAIATEYVDRVECNAVFNSDGELVFDQIIWSVINVEDGGYDIAAWRLLKDVRRDTKADRERWAKEHPGEQYVPSFVGGHATPRKIGPVYVSEWYDQKSRKWRRIEAASIVFVSSTYDRELLERKCLPECKRRGLR